MRKSTYYSVDEFIDELWRSRDYNIALTFLKAEYERRNLPPIEFYKSSGDPSKWPEFIEKFRKHVYFKITFSDKQRMQRLLNILDGEVNRMIQFVGQSSIFYPTVLKCLRQDFGNQPVVLHWKLKALFDRPQLQAKNKPAIRSRWDTIQQFDL